MLYRDSAIFSLYIDSTPLNTTPSFTSLATVDEIFKPLSTGPKGLASNAYFSKDSDNQEKIVDSPPAWGNTSTSLESQASPSLTISATTNNTLDFSPSLLTPRVTRELKLKQSTFTSDVVDTFRHYHSAGVFETPSELLSLNIYINGRDYLLYQNIAPLDNRLLPLPIGRQGRVQV